MSKVKTNSLQELFKEIQESEQYDVEVVRDQISEQVYRIMGIKRMSKADLAGKLKTSPPYITKLLKGNGNFTIETLVKIARALDCKFEPVFEHKVVKKTASVKVENLFGVKEPSYTVAPVLCLPDRFSTKPEADILGELSVPFFEGKWKDVKTGKRD